MPHDSTLRAGKYKRELFAEHITLSVIMYDVQKMDCSLGLYNGEWEKCLGNCWIGPVAYSLGCSC
jgi:hypothetical protein